MYSFKILKYQCTHSMLSKRSKYLVVKSSKSYYNNYICVHKIHVHVCTMYIFCVLGNHQLNHLGGNYISHMDLSNKMKYY